MWDHLQSLPIYFKKLSIHICVETITKQYVIKPISVELRYFDVRIMWFYDKAPKKKMLRPSEIDLWFRTISVHVPPPPVITCSSLWGDVITS